MVYLLTKLGERSLEASYGLLKGSLLLATQKLNEMSKILLESTSCNKPIFINVNNLFSL